MAVVGTALERAVGRDASWGTVRDAFGRFRDVRREYRRTFVVETNDPLDDAGIVLRAQGLPQPFDQFETDAGADANARVIRRTARQADNSRLVWYVDVDYSTEFDSVDNPFTEPPEIVCGAEPFQRPIVGMRNAAFDPNEPPPESSYLIENGGRAQPEDERKTCPWSKGLLNSAGEPFNPPYEETAELDTVSYAVNRNTFTMAFRNKFRGTVNKSPWSGLQARQALCKSIAAQSHVLKSTTVGQPDLYYWRITFTFVINPFTWDLFALDWGPNYKDYSVAPGHLVPFETANGDKKFGLLSHSSPTTLGSKLAESDDPQFLRFPYKREEDFNALNVNLDLTLTEAKPKPRA